MVRTNLGLFAAALVGTGLLTPPGTAQEHFDALSLRVDATSGRTSLVGTTDARAADGVAIVAVENGALRTLGAASAGPDGAFAWVVPGRAFGSVDRIGAVWAGAGGAASWSSRRLPGRNPAAPLAAPPPVRSVIVTEFMKDPAAVSDTRGEWVEVHNRGASPIDLDGWTLRDDGSNRTVLAAPGGAGVVPGYGFLVLGRSDDPLANGGVRVGVTYSGFTLSNGADEIVLEAPGGFEIDRVDYGDGPLWPDDAGRSVSLARSAWGTDLALNPSSWCSGSSPLPAGDQGTPGAVNDACGG